MAKLYNCDKCPAYCCSYDRIRLSAADVKRLARWFELSPEVAEQRFTKRDSESAGRILKHRRDPHFGSVCRFLDPQTRGCTVYSARPRFCRDYPGTARCGYYDFLSFERRAQDDPDWIATTN